MHGTWKTTGGGGAISAGGVLAIAGAAAVIADHRAIEHAGGEVLTALAVTLVVLLVLAVAAFVLLGRFLRRGEDRFAAGLAERRRAAVTAASAAASALPGVPVRAARALPAAQPQVLHYHNHFHGDPRGWQLLSGHLGAGKSQVTRWDEHDEEVPR